MRQKLEEILDECEGLETKWTRVYNFFREEEIPPRQALEQATEEVYQISRKNVSKPAEVFDMERSVSIVVPAYNEGKNIGGVLGYLIGLSYWLGFVNEILVVDDGSEDDTWEIIKRYSENPKVYGIRHKEKLGAGIARETGGLASTGEVIAYLDGDAKIEGVGYENLLIHALDGDDDLIFSAFGKKEGRVTNLVAKPLYRILFPKHRVPERPLTGQYAVSRKYLLEFCRDYGHPAWSSSMSLWLVAQERDYPVSEVYICNFDHNGKKTTLRLVPQAEQAMYVLLNHASENGGLSLSGANDINSKIWYPQTEFSPQNWMNRVAETSPESFQSGFKPLKTLLEEIGV